MFVHNDSLADANPPSSYKVTLLLLNTLLDCLLLKTFFLNIPTVLNPHNLTIIFGWDKAYFRETGHVSDILGMFLTLSNLNDIPLEICKNKSVKLLHILYHISSPWAYQFPVASLVVRLKNQPKFCLKCIFHSSSCYIYWCNNCFCCFHSVPIFISVSLMISSNLWPSGTAYQLQSETFHQILCQCTILSYRGKHTRWNIIQPPWMR